MRRPTAHIVLDVSDLVLPARNEARAHPWLLDRMPGGLDPSVVDDGSTDGSAKIAGRLGASVAARARGDWFASGSS